MCNPSWSAFECILTVYLSQLLGIVLGIILLIMWLVTIDEPKALPENQQWNKKYPLKSTAIREPLIKIKDSIYYRIQIKRQIRIGLLMIGALFLLGGVGWLLINQSQKPVIAQSPTPFSSANPSNTTPGKQAVLYIEELPFWAFSYGLGNDFIPPTHFSRLNVNNYAEAGKGYKIDFSMPLQGDAGAGVSFMLSGSVDLTDYFFIELAAQFKNSQCDLFLKDTSGGANFVTVSDSTPANLRVSVVDGKWWFKIPLSNFTNVNLKSIKEIGCNAHRCEGDCSFELGNIQFSKP